MPRSKKIGQRIHAKRRCFARYGISITSRQIKQIVRKIQLQIDATMLHRVSNRRSIWKVYYLELEIIVVYDSGRSNIATFLPPAGFVSAA